MSLDHRNELDGEGADGWRLECLPKWLLSHLAPLNAAARARRLKELHMALDAARQEGARGGEPVAWRLEEDLTGTSFYDYKPDAEIDHKRFGGVLTPLYASPAEPSGWRPIESEKHELDCLRRQVGQLDYPCSPHCAGYLREFAMRNTAVKALRLYTRRTDSGVGAHVIVEIERHDGSTAEIIREFADISDTIIDHWARLPPTSEGGGA